MIDRNGATAMQIDQPAPATLRVPLLTSLADLMLTGGYYGILDLGAAQSAKITFCNQFRCRVDIANLPPELDAFNQQEDPRLLSKQVEAILPDRHRTADIVFCWDLLNYLQRPALTAIMDGVAARSRSGTLIHALIFYATARMPALPGLYSPYIEQRNDSEQEVWLEHAPDTAQQCDAPRYTPDDLTHCLRGYRVERAVLLNNGMQEFLFRL